MGNTVLDSTRLDSTINEHGISVQACISDYFVYTWFYTKMLYNILIKCHTV